MPELTQLYQKQLDDSQLCPICQAAMHFIEGEYHHKAVQYHHCSHCQHCIFYGDQPLQCHCPACLVKRQRQIQQTRWDERKDEWQKKHKRQDNVEFLLDDLSLMNKLFLLSLLDVMVDENRPHHEFLDFSRYQPTKIAPSFQLYKFLKQHFIHAYYLISKQENDTEQFYTNLKLAGYRDPSLLSLTHQLRAWFYQNFTQGVPFKDSQEVKDTLLDLLAHEILNFCQYRCQKWQVQFYGNQVFIDYCKLLLNDLAATQIFFLIDRALNYLNSQQLLDRSNQNFVNTNRLRKTLMQYRERAQQQSWETGNTPRPPELPYSQMTHIFLDRFLKFSDHAFCQPLWKSWQDVVPKLQFFTQRHCIHCGSKDLMIEYSDDRAVSFTCLSCKQQDHYFIK